MIVHHLVPLIFATYKLVDGAGPEFASSEDFLVRVQSLPGARIFVPTPPLRTQSEICSYRLTNRNPAINKWVPFKVNLVDKSTGHGQLAAIDSDLSLDCRKKYEYALVAVDCQGVESAPHPLTVTVENNENLHDPYFQQQWYQVDVKEGQLYTQVIKLTASDDDCDSKYGAICAYEFSNAGADTPFAIDSSGVIKNIRPLNYSETPTYILSVIAKDCGMRSSQPTLVTIYVQQQCQQAIRGVDDQLSYYKHTGAKAITPAIELAVCNVDATNECQVDKVNAHVHLATEHIGRGCDRDPYLSAEQLKTCGFTRKPVELMPRSQEQTRKRDQLTSNNAKVISIDDIDAEEAVAFDGESRVIGVPDATMSPVVPKTFSLSFWMRHDEHILGGGHQKESIICSSDDHELNRHHFAVYVRNCKLEMLVRQEADPSIDLHKYKEQEAPAAEWRWSTKEVCDDTWHQYTIVYDNNKASLYIDGEPFVVAVNNPEILYDRPLHVIASPKARLAIGACYHAKADKYAQFFKGQLSSMIFVDDIVQPASILCSHQCNEQLQFSALTELVPGQAAQFNAEHTMVNLTATTLADMQSLLRRLTYINTRDEPTPGHRRIDIDATVACHNKAPIVMQQKSAYLFVEKTLPPTLSLSGHSTLHATRAQIAQGATMFNNLQITVTQNGDDVSDKHQLDKCVITPSPAKIDSGVEFFTSPQSIGELGLDFEHTDDRLILSGGASVRDYEKVLRELHYFHSAPQNLVERKYSLECSMLSGTVTSAALEVVLESITDSTVPSSKSDPAPPIREARDHSEENTSSSEDPKSEQVLDGRYHAQRMSNMLEMDLPGPKSMLHNGNFAPEAKISAGSFAGGAVAVIVVACVGFLLVLLIVGIVRLRSPNAGQRRRYRRANSHGEGQDGLTWDDGELNIIVNPLEDGTQNTGQANKATVDEMGADGEESDSDDEDRFDMVDATEDEEDDHTGLPHVATAAKGQRPSTGLEWDDSPMANNANYRV